MGVCVSQVQLKDCLVQRLQGTLTTALDAIALHNHSEIVFMLFRLLKKYHMIYLRAEVACGSL